ncbi:oligopeptide/dipeptide ABC transporter ATP-binding protein [Acutalibacter caecimuris]|uniref:oligopeptide/dipeptide ABC transporter ATP-binding protein n=1 Tax=Acutalibacter caecimuris TaxID=3093657 RepID=UPI002AC9D045|nr:oligopeptide/dipeptide ABC transporter ATP-binding protein [Acutalibacter sp. M00118]
MENMNQAVKDKKDEKVLLSVKDLEVKFRVRGRILTAIRGISLDIYENETIAIVGESGSGKSVFTKTFAGMLDSNGFIDKGSILFNDEELADTHVKLRGTARNTIANVQKKLDEYARLEPGAETFKKMKELESQRRLKMSVSDQERKTHEAQVHDLEFKRAETFNLRQTLDSKTEKARIRELGREIKGLDTEIRRVKAEFEGKVKANSAAVKNDSQYNAAYNSEMAALKAQYDKEIAPEISAQAKKRNEILAKEIYLSVGRYPFHKRVRLIQRLLKELKKAMEMGIDPMSDQIFDKVVFRVRYLDETADTLHGTCTLNLANVKFAGDWGQIRGRRIATVFQDPMTSLNPIITIGKQISSIIIKHQGCSEAEARARAIQLMHKVGIPNAEARFDDYPFQYSGGMRQRIVIAIALSCQPKILICDEPTTALDVTIQAQIIRLLKDLQKEFGYTIVFITHDLGVVANVADRVAVLYAGQIVELGGVEEVFYDPRHPYTWALLSSLPQLAQRNTKLYSITGTPPSLYNQIVGDPFAPRNPYCLKLDTLMEPPMFPVTETHFAKTWLLDPRAPKMEKPEMIQDIHEKLMRAFNI